MKITLNYLTIFEQTMTLTISSIFISKIYPWCKFRIGIQFKQVKAFPNQSIISFGEKLSKINLAQSGSFRFDPRLQAEVGLIFERFLSNQIQHVFRFDSEWFRIVRKQTREWLGIENLRTQLFSPMKESDI